MTRRGFVGSIVGAVMDVTARAWCPGAIKSMDPVRVEPERRVAVMGDWHPQYMPVTEGV